MHIEKKAVALKYDFDNKEDVPCLIAVGEGYLADKIIEVAQRENIPLIENKEVVSKLISLPVGVEIPQELYEAVAKILVFIYKLERDYT